MHISSSSGAGTAQSLTQLAKLLAQSSETSTETQTSETTATSSAASSFSENESFFLSALSSGTLSELFQTQYGGQGRPNGPPPAGGPSGGFQPPSLDDMDSDGDGSLTQAEMESWETATHGASDTSRASELFSKMDSDGDGSVTAEEKTAFDDQMATRGPGRGGQPQQAPQGAQQGEGTSQETLAAMMQELMTALESYGATKTAEDQTSSLSIAA